MRHARFAINAMFGAAVLVFTSGCYSYKTLTIHVKDGSTGGPIQDAKVVVFSRVSLNPFPPKASTGYTNKNGNVTLQFTPDAGIPTAQASKVGYIHSGNIGITKEYSEGRGSASELQINLEKDSPSLEQ